MRHLMLLTLLPLAGCDLINEGRDLIGDLTNPLVTQALVLGVTQPDEIGDITFPDEFAEGAAATVFLADAADVADLENAPIGGATVTIQEVAIPEQSAGAYVVEPGALSYEAGATFDLTITIGDSDPATGVIDLPQAATFDLADTLAPNSEVTIDLTGQEFDSALIVVVNQDGDLTYDNRPEGITELYELTRGDGFTTETIPGTAFPTAGAYAIGVAGIRTTTGRDALEAMNTALSTMMAGNMVFEPVAVVPDGA